jgi:flagellar biosynthesis protein
VNTLDDLLNKDQALALFYDGGQAPVVSDQKSGEAAQKLIQQALDLGIPIYENPQLLEQLSELQMGQQVPTELYQLIAEILAFAFFIQGKAPENYESFE